MPTAYRSSGTGKKSFTPNAPTLSGLVPFDAAGTLNDLHLALEDLRILLSDTPFPDSRPKVVRYSTLPLFQLKKLLSGVDGFRIDLFEPKPRMELEKAGDGSETIRWIPDVDPEGKYCWNWLDRHEGDDPLADCVFVEGCTQTGRLFMTGCTVARFRQQIEEIRDDPDGFEEWRDVRIGFWRHMWQHAARFELRMLGGEIHRLDASVWAMENLDTVYQTFVTLREKVGLFNRTPPKWVVERDGRPPLDSKKASDLDRFLWGAGSDCALFRSAKFGSFTADGSVLLTADPFLLPHHFNKDDPCLTWSATAKEPPLPDSCDFHPIEPQPDDGSLFWQPQPDDVTSWKCSTCGYTFSSSYVEGNRNGWLYRACGCSDQWDAWKAAETAGDGPRRIPRPADGPQAGNEFHFNGEIAFLTTQPFRLLSAMWGQKSRDIDAVTSEAWPVDRCSKEPRKLGPTINRVNNALQQVGYPSRLSQLGDNLIWKPA